MAKTPESPLKIVALTSLALLAAIIAKYPNRAIFTRARPDLKKITIDGHPLFGNMLQALTSKENPLMVIHKAFQELGDIYTITVPYRGRFFMVNHPMYMEHILKSKLVLLSSCGFPFLPSFFYGVYCIKDSNFSGILHRPSTIISFIFMYLIPNLAMPRFPTRLL